MIDFLLKERSKLVSYKKENQKVITEEETKPRKSVEKRKRDS